MKHMMLSLLLLSLLPALAFAQADDAWQGVDLGALDQPVASVDNLFIPLANPSLLGTGHASGLGWAHMFDDMKLRDHYWFLANLDNLSYTYEFTKEGDRSVNYHTLAAGSEMMPRHILPNLYGGLNYRWRNADFGQGSFRTAFTYRPHASGSVAFRWDNPYKESPQYHAGIAFRPFAFLPSIADKRLELSADIDYSKEDGDYGFREPVLGIHTRVVDGLNLGATYNLDTETALLNFSLSFGETDAGALVSTHENSNFAVPYVHFTDDVFSPFLGIKKDKWYDMKLKGSLVTYEAPKYEFGPFKIYDGNTQSIEDVIKDLKQAKDDPEVKGILLNEPAFGTSQALQQELVAAFRDFKSSGKKVVAYYNNISNGGYIFASSVADQIFLNPLGGVDLRGMSVSSPYFKELLDHIGVDVVNLRSHKYKSAGNMLSEPEMTPAEREEYESLLQSLYSQMVSTINEGRGAKLKQSVEETIDNGPYFLAQDALDAGLIDGLLYEDHISEQLKDDHGFARRATNLPEYRDYTWSHPKQNLIAVIYASGNIIMGNGTAGTVIAQETTAGLIRAARKNKDYKGIILRVDSGGGSAQASDIILRELGLAQTVDKKKVVVSMAGVAASGGYYISCKADRIIADPATLTGSIGVVGILFNMPRLFDKVKVNWSTVKKGENADLGSLSRSMTSEEKIRLESMIEAIYDDFVNKVDAGRANLSKEQVHAIAQGRVWTGEQALANGLIDALGGMDKAVEEMRELTGIKGDLTLVDATSSHTGFVMEMKDDMFGGLMNSGLFTALAGDYIQLYELWRDFGSDSVLMLSPLGAESIQY